MPRTRKKKRGANDVADDGVATRRRATIVTESGRALDVAGETARTLVIRVGAEIVTVVIIIILVMITTAIGVAVAVAVETERNIVTPIETQVRAAVIAAATVDAASMRIIQRRSEREIKRIVETDDDRMIENDARWTRIGGDTMINAETIAKPLHSVSAKSES
jgi:hypothetical protein